MRKLKDESSPTSRKAAGKMLGAAHVASQTSDLSAGHHGKGNVDLWLGVVAGNPKSNIKG